MRVIYKADDGQEFSTKDACHRYQYLTGRVSEIVGNVVPPARSDQYVQLAKYQFDRIRRELIDLAVECGILDERFLDYESVHPMGIAGRLIDENEALRKGWHILCCVNPTDYKLYQQPFFALNPEVAKRECVNRIYLS